MAGWRRRPSPEAGTRLARLLGPASWSGLQLPPGRRGGTTLSRLLSGREQPAASRPPVCWCVRGDRRGPGHGRQRPMYNSSQEKKTVARPEGLLLPLGTPGRDSPCPWRKGLQRPLELVPRQVLPDGGLGAGGIPQFSPDHLGQRGGVSGAPRPPRAYRGHARAATRPTSPEPRGQAGTETTLSHNHPRGHTRHPERVATGAQARPRAAQWARRPRRQQERRAQTRPAEGPGPAPGNHPPPLAPARVQARVGAAGREARVSPLPRAKAAPALQTHGLEAPACTTGAATRGASQLGGQKPDPWGWPEGWGTWGQPD